MEHKLRKWLNRFPVTAGRIPFDAAGKPLAARLGLGVSRGYRRRLPVALQRPEYLPSMRDILGLKSRPHSLDVGSLSVPSIGESVPHHGAHCSVILLVHNDLSLVRRCLSLLVHPQRHKMPLVIVDDGSDAFVARYLAEFAAHQDKVVLIRLDNVSGPGASYNAGIKAAGDGDLWLLDPRGLVNPGLFDSLAASANAEGAGLSVPLSNTGTDVWLRPNPGDSFISTVKLVAHAAFPQDARCIFPEEGCLYIRASAFEKTGPLSARYSSVAFTFMDYVLRAGNRGFGTFCCPRAYLYHQSPPYLPQDERIRADTAELLREWGSLRRKAKDDDPQAILAPLRLALSTDRSSNFLFREEASSFYHEPFVHMLKDPSVPERLKEYQSRLREYLENRPAKQGKSRIVFLVNRLESSSSALAVVDMVNDLIFEGLDVQLVVHSARTYDTDVELLTEPIFFKNTEELIEHFPEADVIVGTSWSAMYPIAEIFLRRPNFAPAYFVDDFELPTISEQERKLHEWYLESYRLTPYCFARTPWTCDRVREAGGEIQQVPPSLDLAMFYPRVTDVQEGEKIVLTMFRPGTPLRGFATGTEVFRRLGARRHDFVVHAFGSTDEDLERHRMPFPLVNHGRVPNHLLPGLYSRAYCFTEFSDFHGFNRAIAESLACGTPAVATLSGGAELFCIDGFNSLTAEPGDVDALVANLEQLLDQPDFRQSLSRKCRSSVAKYDRVASARFMAGYFKRISRRAQP